MTLEVNGNELLALVDDAIAESTSTEYSGLFILEDMVEGTEFIKELVA